MMKMPSLPQEIKENYSDRLGSGGQGLIEDVTTPKTKKIEAPAKKEKSKNPGKVEVTANEALKRAKRARYDLIRAVEREYAD
jgi:hypothetical protein